MALLLRSRAAIMTEMHCLRPGYPKLHVLQNTRAMLPQTGTRRLPRGLTIRGLARCKAAARKAGACLVQATFQACLGAMTVRLTIEMPRPTHPVPIFASGIMAVGTSPSLAN